MCLLPQETQSHTDGFCFTISVADFICYHVSSVLSLFWQVLCDSYLACWDFISRTILTWLGERYHYPLSSFSSQHERGTGMIVESTDQMKCPKAVCCSIRDGKHFFCKGLHSKSFWLCKSLSADPAAWSAMHMIHKQMSMTGWQWSFINGQWNLNFI